LQPDKPARHDAPTDARAMSRRDFIRTGAAGAAALGLGAGPSPAQAADSRCQSLILLWMQGGVSHLDTFDPKPDAPADIRGPFKAIGTNVPGIRLGEHLSRLARVADKLAFIRSMHHGESAHEHGMSQVLSGCAPLPGVRHPSLGSIISNEFGWREGMPAYVAVPGTSFAAALGHLGHGWLDAAHQPLAVGADSAPASLDLRELQLPQESVVERVAQEGGKSHATRSTRFCAAMNLEKEPARVREAYGDSDLGRNCLLARRLVEMGARCVVVDEDGWDHHFRVFDSLQRRLPAFDRAVSALIHDLDDRGLLKTTMVLFLTEFGRSPRINGEAGREHWPDVFSVIAAGGGVRGGQAIGASDARGESPAENAITPGDLVRTVCHQMDMDPDRICAQPVPDRQTSLASRGRVIREMV
jgi:Protein of unknown function (DUF1501)/TAT (twin-arginine translocation) pathway signal sequence